MSPSQEMHSLQEPIAGQDRFEARIGLPDCGVIAQSKPQSRISADWGSKMVRDSANQGAFAGLAGIICLAYSHGASISRFRLYICTVNRIPQPVPKLPK
jgi:hypothetical protein